MQSQIVDKHFQVDCLSASSLPQQLILLAARQDYIEQYAHDRFRRQPGNTLLDLRTEATYTESEAGKYIIDKLLAGGRGHFGPFEHPQIVLNIGWFPHSVMQQARTHRLLSFDVQSFRFSGQRILDTGLAIINGTVSDGVDLEAAIDKVFYIRPVGVYGRRKGGQYEYTAELRAHDIAIAATSAMRYARAISDGASEEQARSVIPFDVRQCWVMSCNMRALIHFLTIRGKADAQLEIRQLCELILPHFESWAPEVYAWFMQHQWQRGRLAP